MNEISTEQIFAGLAIYVGITMVTEAISGDHVGRSIAVGGPLLAIAWAVTRPGGRAVAANALASASSVLGSASASLARAGMDLGAKP